MIPAELKYTASHEWVRLEADGTVSIGITHHAQDRLGDLVYIEPPKVGQAISKGGECGVVESVKAAADLYAPISGQVVATNEALSSSPEQVNQDAYAAWMFRIRPTDRTELDTLLDATAYERIVAADAH